jgi:hypothetical protein
MISSSPFDSSPNENNSEPANQNESEIRMRKVIATLLATALLGFGYAPSASAAAKITVSKTSDLAFDGEKVTLQIADFPAKSGLYLFQCVQPAGGGALPDLRQCNSADQLWITASGRGSFLPTASEISMRLVGKFSTFDCTVDKCALFAQFDRLAADDRSEDQFIPLTFKAATGAGTPAPTVTTAPVAQGIGEIRKSIRVGQSLSLPALSDKGVTVAYRVKTPKVCSLVGTQVKAKRVGNCAIDAYAAPSQGVAMFAAELAIKVAKRKK